MICGLLARFSDANRYTVLWSDPASKQVFERIVGEKAHIGYANPVGSTANSALFAWQMTKLSGWLARNGADLVLNVNHHFPTGNIRQVIYHLNVLRFERPRLAIWKSGEIADRLRDWRARIALSKADSNVFESHYLMQLAKRSASAIENGSVIYIGLEDGEARAAHAAPSASYLPHIIALTSPQPHKDNSTLIRMLARLVAKRPAVDWRLKIAGGRTPEAFADLRALANDVGVGDKIDWLGFRRHEELAKIGHNCLCLVSTSKVESFCMVALEAMSWGCPAIVANATSMPESVGDAGILAEPSDPSDFAAKVIELHDNPGLRDTYARRGLAHAGKTTWTSAAREFEAVFENLPAKK